MLQIATAVFAVVFLFSAVMFVRELRQSKKEADTFEELAALRLPQEERSARTISAPASTAQPISIHDAANGTGEATPAPAQKPLAEGTTAPNAEDQTTETEPAERKPLKRYLPLYELNPDFFAWITIPDTSVDYPVMYNAKDTLKYLGHDFFGNFAYSGVPYIDSRCDLDGSLYLIYGHSMRNGSMFGGLLAYDNKDFWETHKEILFDTLYEERTYEVVMVMRARVLDRDEAGFRYYNYASLNTQEEFEDYMQQARRLSRYDTGIKTSFGDELLILSTCFHYTENGRLVVIAKRVS